MKLSPAQVVMLVVLLAVLSFMVQFAIAKWRYERKRRKEREEQLAARKQEPPAAPPA